MPADFSFQLINLIFILPPVLKAFQDSHLQLKKNRSPDHKKSILGYSVLMLLLAFIDFKFSPVEYYLQSAFLASVYFFLIFDYLRNLLVGKSIFYIDSNPDSDPEEDSWVDTQIYSRIGPLGTLFLKCWTFGLGIAIYYYFSYI